MSRYTQNIRFSILQTTNQKEENLKKLRETNLYITLYTTR